MTDQSYTEPITDWRTIRPGERIVALERHDEFRWSDEPGTVARVEPCQATDSAWVYVRIDGDRTGIDTPFLCIDGHSPRLGRTGA